MSGYRWRGCTRRNQAYRRWADAQWEHDQRCHAQRNRRSGVAPEAPSPVSGATPSADPTSRPAANGGPTP